MIGFRFEARYMMEGRIVEFTVARGHQAADAKQLGALTFDPAEWEEFRHIVVNGMRAAGYLKIPVEFMDQTRKRPHSVH
jgi:hypothetical protein